MRTLFLFLALLFVCLSFDVSAQKQADWWYFGNFAGVRFGETGPEGVTDGALTTEEGCSVISNKLGQLLFYTDGITVWNSAHQIMSNGAGLLGDPSSTQSGVAISRPKHPNEYYLFTVAATAKEPGMSYSLIDMQLDGGKGQVVQAEKNVKLAHPVTEKMTAVLHRNGIDIWVIGHRWESDEFIAFLVTEQGVVKEPVVTKSGAVHKGGLLNTQGYMKSNPDGTNLALALEESNIVEMFDFDNATGIVSNPISVKLEDKSYVYGIEFSPNGSLLYATAAGLGDIVQFNLQAGSPEAIQASQVKIGGTPNKEWVGALQLAANGKIYFPIYKTSFLGSIESPNEIGVASKMLVNTVDLKGKLATLGLPTFTQSFFEHTEVQKVTYFDGVNAKKGQKLVLKNIQFDFAKATLQPSSFVELKKVVTYLKAHPTVSISISGHTDNVGNKSANLKLSTDRANSVREYLVSQGIVKERLLTEGFGSGLPIESNATDAGRALNRRVEFEIR